MKEEGYSMRLQKELVAVVAALCWAVTAGTAMAGPQSVVSPSGHAVIRIDDDGSRFSVLRRGRLSSPHHRWDWNSTVRLHSARWCSNAAKIPRWTATSR
ncbi:hypothetical protein [Lysobacter gummosus]|uniref:hypothetical protein n=1 Tax=Lysobacter gummosus TaxID=262324 RepID=UPI003637C880